MSKIWSVYLSGEIHTDWRERIIAGSKERDLPMHFVSPVTDHPASDAAGDGLGREESGYWRDHTSSKVNAIRTLTHLRECDVAIIRFGSEYKQWNAAFDAGQCAALGKPYVTLHDESLVHPLKEVDAQALGWAQTPEQVVQVLAYVSGRPEAPLGS